VKWLLTGGHAADEEDALTVGNTMLQAGLLHHVAYEHTFKANDLLYKCVYLRAECLLGGAFFPYIRAVRARQQHRSTTFHAKNRPTEPPYAIITHPFMQPTNQPTTLDSTGSARMTRRRPSSTSTAARAPTAASPAWAAA